MCWGLWRNIQNPITSDPHSLHPGSATIASLLHGSLLTGLPASTPALPSVPPTAAREPFLQLRSSPFSAQDPQIKGQTGLVGACLPLLQHFWLLRLLSSLCLTFLLFLDLAGPSQGPDTGCSLEQWSPRYLQDLLPSFGPLLKWYGYDSLPSPLPLLTFPPHHHLTLYSLLVSCLNLPR